MRKISRMPDFTHFDEQGNSRMVDVGDKPVSARLAVATGRIECDENTVAAIEQHKIAKGNVFEVARLAGIMACKRTSDLIPLCHPLPIDGIQIDFEIIDEFTIKITSAVKTRGRTGVEMEAMTACSVAALTVYDMCKSIDRSMVVSSIKLVEKRGGKSGVFVRDSLDR